MNEIIDPVYEKEDFEDTLMRIFTMVTTITLIILSSPYKEYAMSGRFFAIINILAFMIRICMKAKKSTGYRRIMLMVVHMVPILLGIGCFYSEMVKWIYAPTASLIYMIISFLEAEIAAFFF